MKAIREQILKDGSRNVTFNLLPGEMIRQPFHEERYYKLGCQVDDIVSGGVLIDAEEVYWCNFEQKWKDA